MSDVISLLDPQEGFRNGLTVEHVLISLTIVSTKEGVGQFDDSAAFILERGLKTYHGVEGVSAKVLHKTTFPLLAGTGATPLVSTGAQGVAPPALTR